MEARLIVSKFIIELFFTDLYIVTILPIRKLVLIFPLFILHMEHKQFCSSLVVKPEVDRNDCVSVGS